MDRQKVADTPLAQWLNEAMSKWQDPDTQVYGLNQNQLRHKSGLSQASIWGILKKGHTPKPEIVRTLAEFFDVSPSYLFRLAYMPDEPHPDPEAYSRFEDIVWKALYDKGGGFVKTLECLEDEVSHFDADDWAQFEAIRRRVASSLREGQSNILAYLEDQIDIFEKFS